MTSLDETDLSPAERYARAKRNKQPQSLIDFLALLEFGLDDFQEASCRALADGKGVLVAAPTGAGKTVVGEFAIHLALEKDQKVFYTTPIKALSNQKYAELAKRYGDERVGLLTGDTNTNSDAQIVVMTTEVLRNMIYANSESLIKLGYVVMDEVHYLADRFRGAVWEEVILHLPRDVKVVSLSATVSNAEEFGAWLDEVRGDTAIIVSEHRPVPLNQHVLFGEEMIDLFGSGFGVVNPELVEKHQTKMRQQVIRPTGGRGGKGNKGGYRPHQAKGGSRGFDGPRIERLSKPEMIEILDQEDMLPAIFFIFSRAGCEAAVKASAHSSIRLTNQDDRNEIRRIVEDKVRNIPDEDLSALGYFEWLSGLERGVAAHHAGMLPAFKDVVELLFLKRLVKVVFATETLALGINMPARTVVLERLDKYNGEGRVQITPGEYTQLTGRAGRRGIDTQGHSVIQWSGQMDPNIVSGLASKRTYPLVSPFRPTYNMSVNLVAAFGRERAREVLETSFAQFQADRSVVGLARGIRDREASLTGFEESMQCHLGDFAEYAAMRREISDLERALASGYVRVQRGKDLRQSKGRTAQEEQLAGLKRRVKSHPCNACPEREAHSRWGERWHKLRRETDGIIDQIEGRTNQVARVFDRICSLLVDLEYLTRDVHEELEVTEAGSKLARIYGERDLLIAEALRHGVWSKLDPASLASMAAALVYEARRDEGAVDPQVPKGLFISAAQETEDLWHDLDMMSRQHKLPQTPPLDFSLTMPIYRWATGARLDTVLEMADLLPGDFIRWSKQIIDLLDQIASVAEAPVAQTAKAAVDKVKRGIVAYSYYG